MASFLRDELITDVKIDEESLSKIFDLLLHRMFLMPEYLSNPDARDAFLIVTIRFDEKGYRVFDKDTLLKYFNEAGEVERIVFELSCGESIRSSKNLGSYVDLRLDKHEGVMCYSTVCSDDENWMNGTFCAINEILRACKNYNSWARGPWFELIVQLSGIFLGFIISLWGASIISPNLKIENAYLISFLLVLLVFSNLWGYINVRIKNAVFSAFPKIAFNRPHKDKLNWLKQAVIGGIVAATCLYLIALGFEYIGRALGSFVG